MKLLLITLFAFMMPTISVATSPTASGSFFTPPAILSSAPSAVNNTQRLYFKDLRTWRMGASEVPADLKKFDGQTVQIVGYMVPFDSIEKIERFILLQAPFMGCFHVPPPQPNETLMINATRTPADYVYEPIMITGRLKIEETYVDRYLVSLYTIEATRIQTVRQSEAELEGLPANLHMFGEF